MNNNLLNLPDYDSVEEEKPGPVKPGTYGFKIAVAYEKEPRTGGRMLVLKLRFDDGHICWDNIKLVQKLRWKLEGLAKSIGHKITIPPAPADGGALDWDSEIDDGENGWSYLQGLTGRAVTGLREYQGKQYTNIKKYI